MNIKKLKNIDSVTLHKVNKAIVYELSLDMLNSMSVSISDIDTIELTIPQYTYVGFTKTKYMAFDEVKEERLICLNNNEYFVIKDIKEEHSQSNKYKKVTAYSLEHKLGKIDIEVEDIGFQLKTPDEENGIYSLNDYIKSETGWSFGIISDKVLNDVNGEKMRWQESVNTNWYDYIIKDVREQFECVPFFNTNNKTIDLYHIDDFGDEIKIALSYDGYIKSLEKVGSSQDIVTRLLLIGNEDMDIIGATPSGYKYIEDYSYFIENNEMSNELIEDIKKYEEMVSIRTITWNELIEQKSVKSSELKDKKNELYILYANIKANESMLKVYKLENDTVNEAKILAELTKLRDQQVILEQQVSTLETEVNQLQASIDEINILCKRETCTDENGVLVFTSQTLEELKDFLYYDTYSEDAFLDAKDLIQAGRRKLDLKCKPTSEFDIDVVNFMSRIIDNGFNQHWNGELDLGNIVALVDDEGNECLRYFVGYTRDFRSNSLNLNISSKKLKTDSSKDISDYLRQAKTSMQSIKTNRYLWMNQKKNRINLDYNKGGGNNGFRK